MKTEVENAVKMLAERCTNKDVTAVEAMRFAEATLNMAQALIVLQEDLAVDRGDAQEGETEDSEIQE